MTEVKSDMKFKKEFFSDEVREGYYVPAMMKKCWAAQLEVLNDVDEICQKYNIEYFAEWGTLLGAIRHGGFIPWDDDMDICMKRPDYEKFLKVIEKEFKGRYIVENFNTTDARNNFLTRISNINQFRFDEEFIDKYHGFPYPAGIDVFQLDYAPSKENEEAFVKEMKYLITVGENENAENITKEQYDNAIRNVEKKYTTRIDRSRPTMSQIYQIADRLCGSFPESDTDYITLMPVWLLNHNYLIPKELYSGSVRVPFENTTIPVPIGYDRILEIKYHNYMKPVRDWSSHDYPYYRQHEEILKNKYEIELSKYTFKDSDLEKMLPDSLRAQLLNFIPVLAEAHNEIVLREEELANLTDENTIKEKYNEIYIILQDCQSCAIEMGNLIEKVLKNNNTVTILEQYCEVLFELSENLSKEKINALNEVLFLIKESVRNDIPAEAGTVLEILSESIEQQKEKRTKKLAIFIVSKVREWKYISGVFEKYRKDSKYITYLMPVSYYRKHIDGRLMEKYCEFELFDDDIPKLQYELYDIKSAHPDIIFIQDVFDEANVAFSINPEFYSSRLKNYTDKLIYIPPFETDEIQVSDERCKGIMNDYVVMPGVINADEVLVQSSNIRERYIEVLSEKTGEENREIWQHKIKVNFLVMDNKIDKEELVYPREWDSVLKDSEGQYKKIIMYYVSFGAINSYPQGALKKILSSLEMFEQYSNKVAVIWRLDANIKSEQCYCNDELHNQLKNLIEEVKQKEWIVVDESKDMNISVNLADSFFGDGCVEATKCRLQEKPVMLQNYSI